MALFSYLRFFSWCGVVNVADNDPLVVNPVKNNVRSSANDQLPDSWSRARAAQMGIISQRLNYRHNPNGQAFCRHRFVLGNILADLL